MNDEKIKFKVTHGPVVCSDGVTRTDTIITDQDGRMVQGVQSLEFRDSVEGLPELVLRVCGADVELHCSSATIVVEEGR